MPFEIIKETTLQRVVQSLSRQVGYPVPPDPAGSLDPAVQQMVAAANQSSTDLRTMWDWTELHREGSISIELPSGSTAKEAAYDLPEDFFEFIDQTQWANQTQLPGIGPVSPQGWMSYLVRTALPMLSIFWQIRNKQLWVLNPPPFGSAIDFVFMYNTLATVRDADDLTLYKNIASKNGDEFILDGYLIQLLARQRWLEYKGFDAVAAARDFTIAMDNRTAAQAGAPVLSLARSVRYPYLSVANTPDTAYGAG